MTANNETYFRKLYLIFGILCSVVCLVEFAYMLICIGSFQAAESFLICGVLLACFIIIFLVLVKKRILKVFAELDHLLDCAIQNTLSEVPAEETELSKFGERLYNYTAIQQEHGKRQEEQKAQAEALISDISHQTKTPIANIMIWEQLLETMELSPKAKEYVNKISGQTKRLNWMIETMVNMSRLETGLIQCQPEENKVIDLIAQSLNPIYERAEKKDIQLTINCDPQQKALFDLKWTAEALTNLLDNSIKYTPSSGKVSIDVIPYELYLRIDVRDTGIGINQVEWNDIFKRFYRSPQVKKEDGVGIGLYLCRKIISLQSGYMKLDSLEGTGSTFSIFLPNVK